MAKLKPNKIRRRLQDLELPEKKDLKAVAIKYNIKKDNAPRIIATGKGYVADKILKLAEEHSIPFCEDPVLTDLLSRLEFEETIPPELYTMVAEVLAYVYQLNSMAKKRNEIKAKKRKRNRN